MVQSGGIEPKPIKIIDVLLVEDNDVDADIFESLADLSKDFYIHITRARSSAEATRLFRCVKFDACFVAFHLFEGSSLKLLASLTAAGARPVVLSNMSLQEAQLYRLPRFLPKGDCSPGRIGAAVREALDSDCIEVAA